MQRLGKGGMGEVYEAESLDGSLRLALKVIGSPDLVSSASNLRRFEREGRAAAAMRTPHIVRVLDVGRDGPSGAPFLAMELLHGEDLHATLRRGGSLAPDVAARIAA